MPLPGHDAVILMEQGHRVATFALVPGIAQQQVDIAGMQCLDRLAPDQGAEDKARGVRTLTQEQRRE